MRRAVDEVDHLHDIVGEGAAVGEGNLEKAVEAMDEGVGDHGLLEELSHRFYPCQKEGAFLDHALQPDPELPLQHYLGPLVGEHDDLAHLADGADFMESVLFIRGIVPSGKKREKRIELKRLLEGEPLLPLQVERKDHVGEGDHILEDKGRQNFGDGDMCATRHDSSPIGCIIQQSVP